MITAKELKKWLEYNSRTGVFTWLTEPNTRVMAGDEAGSITSKGYRRIAINGRAYPAHRLAFLYMTGEFPVGEIDHINGKRHDNRWRNLRPATRAENSRNSKRAKNNSVGFKGVSYHKGNKKYAATIFVDGKRKYLGGYGTPDEAHEAYCKAAREHFGEFARTE